MPRKDITAKPLVVLHMKIQRADGTVEERTVDGRIEKVKPEVNRDG